MQRGKKFAIATLVLGCAAVIILWNSAAQPSGTMMGVSDAKRGASELGDADVTVRGLVLEGSIVYEGNNVTRFVMADDDEQLLVLFDQVPPDAFGAKEVVVKGRMASGDEGVVLRADEIQVGCASKY